MDRQAREEAYRRASRFGLGFLGVTIFLLVPAAFVAGMVVMTYLYRGLTPTTTSPRPTVTATVTATPAPLPQVTVTATVQVTVAPLVREAVPDAAADPVVTQPVQVAPPPKPATVVPKKPKR